MCEKLLKLWMSGKSESFDGVTLEDMPELEHHFKVNIQIDSLQDDGMAKNVYNSCGHHAGETLRNMLYVNQFENHLSYLQGSPRNTSVGFVRNISTDQTTAKST